MAVATILSSLTPINAQADTTSATSTGDIAITGTIKASETLDITVPTNSLDFEISSTGIFSQTSQKSITSNSRAKIYTYVTKVYATSEDAPELVAADTFENWDDLTYEQTIANLSLSLNDEDLSANYVTDADEDTDVSSYIGFIDGTSDTDNSLALVLTGKNGKEWQQYNEDKVIEYQAEMLFTTASNSSDVEAKPIYGYIVTKKDSDVNAEALTETDYNVPEGYTQFALTNAITNSLKSLSNDITVKLKGVSYKINDDKTITISTTYDSDITTKVCLQFGEGAVGTIENIEAGQDITKEFTIASDYADNLRFLNVFIGVQSTYNGIYFKCDGTQLHNIELLINDSTIISANNTNLASEGSITLTLDDNLTNAGYTKLGIDSISNTDDAPEVTIKGFGYKLSEDKTTVDIAVNYSASEQTAVKAGSNIYVTSPEAKVYDTSDNITAVITLTKAQVKDIFESSEVPFGIIIGNADMSKINTIYSYQKNIYTIYNQMTD